MDASDQWRGNGYRDDRLVCGVRGYSRRGNAGARRRGLFQTYRFVVEQDLRDGSLVEVLRDYGGSSRPFVLLYPSARHVTRRVRVFVDFLVEKFSA